MPYNVKDCNVLRSKIDRGVNEKCMKNKSYCQHQFSVRDVEQATCYLKSNKIDSDGVFN